MNQKELNDVLHIHEKEKIFIPNEIFGDLKGCGKLNSASHISFSYCYYGLISYLYRYCKYGERRFQVDDIKEILGYSKNNKTIDFIIKRNGLMDQLRYTKASSHFPVSYKFEDGWLYFELVNRELDIIQFPKNYKIKCPVRGLYRTDESRKEDLPDGTFYDISNTHELDIEIFGEMLSNPNIGVVGVYLYQFIKHKNDLYKSGYTVSYKQVEIESGVSKNTISKYCDLLEKYGYIKVIQNGYKQDSEKEKELLPNTYKVNVR